MGKWKRKEYSWIFIGKNDEKKWRILTARSPNLHRKYSLLKKKKKQLKWQSNAEWLNILGYAHKIKVIQRLQKILMYTYITYVRLYTI